jgi:hypothetical protein
LQRRALVKNDARESYDWLLVAEYASAPLRRGEEQCCSPGIEGDRLHRAGNA